MLYIRTYLHCKLDAISRKVHKKTIVRRSDDLHCQETLESPLQTAFTSFLTNEMQTLAAIIFRLAVKQHENHIFTAEIMPDSGETIAAELVNNIVRGMRKNKRRRHIVSELKRMIGKESLPDQTHDETFWRLQQEWISIDETAVLNALSFKLMIPTGAKILAELVNLSHDEDEDFKAKVLATAQKLAVEFITQ